VTLAANLARCSADLAGRVRRADDVHLLPGHGRALDSGRTVEDPNPDEAVQCRDGEPAVRHAGGNDHRSSSDVAAVAQRDDALVAVNREPGRSVREHELGPEENRLLPGPVRQLTAADSARKAEVVADHRARSGLPTDRLGLDDQRAQPLGRAVHPGRQTSRSGTQDHEIVPSG
jgi:hypothetical protein